MREPSGALELGRGMGGRIEFGRRHWAAGQKDEPEGWRTPGRCRAFCQPSTLNFLLTVRGGLHPEVLADGRGVRFVDAQGAAALTYSELTVLDADGRKLPARFESAGSRRREEAAPSAIGPVRLVTSAATESLHLTIDECGARYPLTIDPMAQSPSQSLQELRAGTARS